MKKHKWVQQGSDPRLFRCAVCNLLRRDRWDGVKNRTLNDYGIDGENWYARRPECGEPLDTSDRADKAPPQRKPGKTIHGNTIYDVRLRKPDGEHFFTAGIAFEDSRNGGIKINLWARPIGEWNGEMWLFPQAQDEPTNT